MKTSDKSSLQIIEKQEGGDRDIAILITEAVFDRLKSANIRVYNNS
jgi:hypothetical protein